MNLAVEMARLVIKKQWKSAKPRHLETGKMKPTFLIHVCMIHRTHYIVNNVNDRSMKD